MTAATLESFATFDWDCEDENTRYLTHAFHPYSAKFIPQIPRHLIESLSKPGDIVLDPFVGSGTALVECKLLGRSGIGLDVNPLACLVSSVKSTPIDPTYLKREVIRFLARSTERISKLRGKPTVFAFADSTEIAGDANSRFQERIAHWFQPTVVVELSALRSEILSVEDRGVRNFLLVALSSILRSVSDAASGYGNLMVSHNPPRKRHVFERFRSHVELMVREMDNFWQLTKDAAAPRVILGDCRNLSDFLSSESVDLICTHPPYMAAVPYAEYQKLSLWWLGFDPKKLDSELIGGQRSRADTGERFEIDMQRCFEEMHSVLKPGRYCCVVIGNPTYRGRVWPLNQTFINQAKDAGLSLVQEIARNKFRLTVGKMREEFIQVFRKG